ncbi:cardiolipin synthase [Adhaeretor mobilis]|uniref:Cardiolipin synthase n=1 Tax=Adhaeretor mobilis TaxID=1930276 RepID=A0A517N2H1_9BACT|nr:cardiolipin synthase [Adhaeretor mobilis]QDT01336.1 Cardiolipin synthase [Adhaeretor mobilis]
MLNPIYLTVAATLLHITVVGTIFFRVVMRKPSVGVSLAWMILVGTIPAVGAVFYLLVGERRVGQRRVRRIEEMRMDYARLAEAVIDKGLTQVDWTQHPAGAQGMDRLGTSLAGLPTVAGSTGKLLTDSDAILQGIAQDIEAAKHSVLMEFYIWNAGGLADDVVEALIRAAERGVSCRVLVDAIGARPWWRTDQPERLRTSGVKVQAACPAGIFRALFSRNDLRLHRKVVVVDGEVAWTGSMNLVDPKFFKQDSDVGQWVDAMLRVEGSVIAPLAMTMISDWMLETDETLEEIVECANLRTVQSKGNQDIQVVPSGPVGTADAALQMLLALINAAQDELVLTTPYFVPDESIVRALRGAAGRGVAVHLVLPERVDSVLTRYASRSYYQELLEVGIYIHLFRGGLLHTKSVTADRAISMFGTVNIDMRSLWLNYEVSLYVYGETFGQHLRYVQEGYIADSDLVDLDEWGSRSLLQKMIENTLRLMSPVL